jgi:hypothetical protein
MQLTHPSCHVLGIQLCKNGVVDGTSVPCTCPGAPSCEECILQPNSPNNILLLLDGDAPDTSAAVDPNNPNILLSSNLDPVTGCRDECLANPACTSFYVHIETASRGNCYLRSSYLLRNQQFEAPGTAFYALTACNKCKIGYFPKERGCYGEYLQHCRGVLMFSSHYYRNSCPPLNPPSHGAPPGL